MSGDLAPGLRQVRRGDDLNELQLVASDGRVVILMGYGLTGDEQIRTREAALRLIRDVLPAEPVPAGPQ